MPDELGLLAVALVTGERAGLPRRMKDSLQASGLAHVVSISGLHMSLVAGSFFWIIRGLLALSEAFGLKEADQKMGSHRGFACRSAVSGTFRMRSACPTLLSDVGDYVCSGAGRPPGAQPPQCRACSNSCNGSRSGGRAAARDADELSCGDRPVELLRGAAHGTVVTAHPAKGQSDQCCNAPRPRISYFGRHNGNRRYLHRRLRLPIILAVCRLTALSATFLPCRSSAQLSCRWLWQALC